MSFPLTIGIIGTVFVPVLAAIGSLATLIEECTITLKKEEEKEDSKNTRRDICCIVT